MTTVAQCMQNFVSGLEPSSREEREAVRQRNVLRGHLEDALAIKEFLISGSFKRHTAIHPLNDIDLFVVLDPNSEGHLRRDAPSVTLAKVQAILDEAYPTKDKPKAQSRSVNVEFSGTGLAFDVVPAFPHQGGGYAIPDRDAGAWIRTNPRVHADYSTAANERSGKKAKPIIKAMKHWNGLQTAKVVRSFHLELMVYDRLNTDPGSYAEGIALAYERLASRVLSPMPEPAGVGPYVDAGTTQEERQRASALFADAARAASRAVEAASAGRTAEAHYHWRSLFGPQYREVGRAPAKKAPAIATSVSYAPDPKRRRFG